MYAPTVYIWIYTIYQMAPGLDQYQYATPTQTSVKHIPELRPPASVVFSSTATDLTVQISAATGDFFLQIAGSDTASREGVLFEEGISTLPQLRS